MTMESDFGKSLCLGSGIPFIVLLFAISVPNGFILVVLYKNPLRCFRKPFSVFLVFIAVVNLFNGVVVCSGEAVMRFLCSFNDGKIRQEGDIVMILVYIGINSSMLLVTAMSVDRFVAVIFPHFYLNKVKGRKLVICNTIICVFSSIFASLQLAKISMDIYRKVDVHLHITFPLTTTSLAYFGIYIFLKKRNRNDLQRQNEMATNRTLYNIKRLRVAQMERKFATTSFLILLFLFVSLIPYYIENFLDFQCPECRKQRWFYAFKESSLLFLFLNSVVNPFLTACRVDELKQSTKVILRLRRQVGQRELQIEQLKFPR